ncbi:MAG: galactose-1-phosphate uridylyltransferase, partial [Desulfatirhabdiaceae bacterium]
MMHLSFDKNLITVRFILPSGEAVERTIEIRTNPITGRTCRIALSRTGQSEPGTDTFPELPPDAENTTRCPFCRPQVEFMTPMLRQDVSAAGRLVQGDSLLFPNLFPYGSHSAVSLFDDRHFVEIGAATVQS